jgi:hypothetical protein
MSIIVYCRIGLRDSTLLHCVHIASNYVLSTTSKFANNPLIFCGFRLRLAGGLRIAHQQLGNIQLVSQYLTILGTLALQLHDCGQAREILKSSLTLAKTLYDIPTQIWILSVFTGMP